jgi:hypothetical protein
MLSTGIRLWQRPRAQAIVHAVNPPEYRNWAALVLPMIENTIAAAKTSGARILLPGTIYNFGPDAFPVFTETLEDIVGLSPRPSNSPD